MKAFSWGKFIFDAKLTRWFLGRQPLKRVTGEISKEVQEQFNQFVSNCIIESDVMEPTTPTVTDPNTSTIVKQTQLAPQILTKLVVWLDVVL